MREKLKFFRSRLAKRFFLMFIASALIPMSILAVVAYNRVTRQMTDQALDRLHQSAKSHALDIFERLLVAEHRLQILQAILPHIDGKPPLNLSSNIMERNKELFTGLLLLRNGKVNFSWGDGVSDSCREMVRKMNLASDTTTLLSLDEGKGWPTLVIVRNLGGHGKSSDYIVGAINPSFLWGLEYGTGLGPTVEFSVWDDQGKNLFCTLGSPMAIDQNILLNQNTKNAGKAELTIQNEPYYGSFWSPFMKTRFQVPGWIVMVMEPHSNILKPIHSFRYIFLCIIAMSFLIVVFLTNRAIRRSLIPIDALMESARKVGHGLFSHRVQVESKDEFHDLAVAFNRMSHEINTQFKRLSARSDLDRAILSTLNIDKIIAHSLDHAHAFISYSSVAISIIETQDPLRGRTYIKNKINQAGLHKIEPFQLDPHEYALILKNRHWLKIDADKTSLSYLQVLRQPNDDYFMVFPVWVKNILFGMVSLGVGRDSNLCQTDLEQMRGFSDHLAVAFSNSNLLKELKELNTGTLHALARTVDAKSSWTAGHSERVANVSIEIGKALGLSQNELDDMLQAALLHDIGKIGTPNSILDKPGKLTFEEYECIKEHPLLGARILQPIKTYERIIPIVEQHHERYDGKGYPFGKSGEDIALSSRIMAVADSYDAMVSDRPYRAGLSREQAIKIIQDEAGHQFDPRIVEAFNQVIYRKDGIIHVQSLSDSSSYLRVVVGSTASQDAKIGSGGHIEGKL